MPGSGLGHQQQHRVSRISRGGIKAQAEGKGFENIFKTAASLDGLKVFKIPEAGRWLGPGTFRPVAGWCDFMLLDQTGRAGFVDTKTIEGERFPYSQLNQDQLKFLESVGDVCPSGYVICFRSMNYAALFFSIRILRSLQPGSSLNPSDGIPLGYSHNIKPSKIFIATR